MYIHLPRACLTLDETTPVELALTPFYKSLLVRVVASATAHEVTAVHSGRCLIAIPAHGAHGTGFGV